MVSNQLKQGVEIVIGNVRRQVLNGVEGCVGVVRSEEWGVRLWGCGVPTRGHLAFVSNLFAEHLDGMHGFALALGLLGLLRRRLKHNNSRLVERERTFLEKSFLRKVGEILTAGADDMLARKEAVLERDHRQRQRVTSHMAHRQYSCCSPCTRTRFNALQS